MIEINTLIKHKSTGVFGTVTAKYNKAIRDDADWEAFKHGFDSCTIATVVDILYHDGQKRNGAQISKIRRTHDIISQGGTK